MSKPWKILLLACLGLFMCLPVGYSQMGDYALRQKFNFWGSDSLETPSGAHEDPRYAGLFFLGPNDFTDLNIEDVGDCALCFAWGRFRLDAHREALFAKDLNADHDGGDVWLWIRDNQEWAAGPPLQVSRFHRTEAEEVSGRFWLRDLDGDSIPELILAESRRELGQQRIEGGKGLEGCHNFRIFILNGLKWDELEWEHPEEVIARLRCEMN